MQDSEEKPNKLLRDVEYSWAVYHTVSGKALKHFYFWSRTVHSNTYRDGKVG